MSSNENRPLLTTCLCSRGYINSRTIESVYLNLEEIHPITSKVVYTHGLPIPDAQNEALLRAVKNGSEWVWFVEEDVVVPKGGLRALFEDLLSAGLPYQAISARYNVNKHTPAYQVSKGKDLLFSGLGCLLFHSSVLFDVPFPFFSVDKEYSERNGKLYVSGVLKENKLYGGQDIDFFFKLQEAGVKSLLSDVTCRHVKLRKFGDTNTNHGHHYFEDV